MASARAWIVTAVLLACLLAGPTDAWFRRRRRRTAPPPACPSPTTALAGAQTTWDGPFTVQCPLTRAISRVQSAHCNVAQDRVWRFECRFAPGLLFIQTYWSPWVNDFDGNMGYTCPFNSVVTGFMSVHSNSHQDRRWRLKCSRKPGMTVHSCVVTGYVNNWDAAMNYIVPPSYYIKGIHGVHHNTYQDRRYRFTLCKVTP
ncbi:PREDICTED: hemagglutinin/amebocyte aggregation factor-like [Branchiostoma belcheri]|uniref:Hemagglutinin/amebocyte aggregation factor-like n=1 Tax=Branchiostoma belcheri TaxID=7741 RepID=A0A6P5AWQ6_BRABE|nr:PREDICTED: hemagglutinin/amebocyte aggregation factor-like [Branchiostoma belcheri]